MRVMGLSVLKTTSMWSNIRNSLWTHGLGCLHETGSVNEVLAPLRQEAQARARRMKEPRCVWGVHIHTHTRTHVQRLSQAWNLFLTQHVLQRAWLAKTQNRNSFYTQISWPVSPLHWCWQTWCSKRTRKSCQQSERVAENNLCFQQAFVAASSCTCEVNGRATPSFGEQNPFNFFPGQHQWRCGGSPGADSLVLSGDGT